MVLDPRQKYKYFEDHWDEIHHEGVYQKTQALYKEFRIGDDCGEIMSQIVGNGARRAA